MGEDQGTSPAMIKGSLVHDAREKYFNTFELAKAVSLETDEEILEYIRKLMPIGSEYDDMYDDMAAFEFELERNLWDLHTELAQQTYRPNIGNAPASCLRQRRGAGAIFS